MTPVASLPMYDWPEVRPDTDRLWDCLREALAEERIAAPEILSRDGPHWEDPGLVLSQTCGMPYRLGLHARVTLIGTPDYGLEGCAPGFYRSALVVRAEDPRRSAAAFAGARFAFNSATSQSGWAALGPLSTGRGLETGAHRASVRAVARGAADIAAIDAVTWRLALAHEPAARRLRVLDWTPPTPGLPMITARTQAPEPVVRAVAAGIAALGDASRATLGLVRLATLREADYRTA